MSANMTHNLNENITAVIRVLIALRGGMTQTDLARMIGADKATISKSFKGIRPWKIEDVEVLADAFDVPPTTFFMRPEDVLRSRCVRPEPHAELAGQLSLKVAA